MPTLLVQEHHLRLCLTDMNEVDRNRLLNVETGLFGDVVECFTVGLLPRQKLVHLRRHLSLLLTKGALLRLLSFLQAALGTHFSKPVLPAQPQPVEVKKGPSRPEMGNLEMQGITLKRLLSAPTTIKSAFPPLPLLPAGAAGSLDTSFQKTDDHATLQRTQVSVTPHVLL